MASEALLEAQLEDILEGILDTPPADVPVELESGPGPEPGLIPRHISCHRPNGHFS